MIITEPIGPEQTLDFLCATSTYLYIFFEGISPGDSLLFLFLRHLRPSIYSGYFMMFIYGFYIFCVLWIMCEKMYLHVYVHVLFICGQDANLKFD
jgi:hypothetical protein